MQVVGVLALRPVLLEVNVEDMMKLVLHAPVPPHGPGCLLRDQGDAPSQGCDEEPIWLDLAPVLLSSASVTAATMQPSSSPIHFRHWDGSRQDPDASLLDPAMGQNSLALPFQGPGLRDVQEGHLDVLPQPLLVLLDRQAVVSAGLNQRVGEAPLRAQGIRRDDAAAKIQPPGHVRCMGDLVLLFTSHALPQHDSVLRVEEGQHVPAAPGLVRPACAGRLAVNGDKP